MMRAMELGDKCTVDKIESLICNFHPDSPVPISVFVPSSKDDFIPNISPHSSSNSDSPVMPRSSKLGGSKRCASRAPRESLLDAQTTVDSDVEEHQRDRLHFTLDHPCSFDTEFNVVGEDELHKYRNRFEIPDSVTLMLLGNRAAWNPPENAVTIYGAMLSCGVTLPLQPFSARFLAEAQIAPAQLAPNSYRILMCLGLMWNLKGYEPPTPLGRDVSARGRLNLAAKKVLRHFTSPDAWSKATPILLEVEISRLAATAVHPLDERGRPFLLDEDKMIAQRLFSRLPARLPRLCDFDTDCDLQARAVKNSEADGEEANDITEGGVESGQPPVHTEVAANTSAAATPSHNGKENVGVSGGGVSAIPIFDMDVPEAPLDPASNLAPRANRGKRPAEATHGGPTEGANGVVPSSKEADESHVPASIPPRTASPSRVASPPVAMGESDVSSGQPQPSGRSELADLPGPSKRPEVSTSGSGVAHEAPPMGSNEAGEGTVSLSDFSATEICSHLINNDVYIGEGWEHVKGKPCNRKMEFFFNCHSLMMSELAENYKYGNKVSREIKRLRVQASVLAAQKLSTEESSAQQLAHIKESADGHLSAQIAAEEKLSAAEEEVCLLKEQLSASQESLTARLEAKRIAEEAKERAEHETQDLRSQLSSRELIFDNLKAVLEAEAVDRFKRSPIYDALLLCEFEHGMR
ncbi:hypothetical protein LWI29_001006 [Acer saccharum]|uniref:Uncharacterized protein n=1 Tax=Acer saccharum TaxID=4024 RepID=A0AA39SQ98_ACESA|nr:hypothetical protein LWI29_001006 [Acer saccharum]